MGEHKPDALRQKQIVKPGPEGTGLHHLQGPERLENPEQLLRRADPDPGGGQNPLSCLIDRGHR